MRDFGEANCPTCCQTVKKKKQTQRFCSAQCKGKYKYLSNHWTTEKQYSYISGNWEKYLNRLALKRRRETGINVDVLMQVLKEQNYLCALTGKELTCLLEVGVKYPTNASIDRIIAGGPYVKENIQLVCAAVNSFRKDLSVAEFVAWCKAVANHHQSKVQYERA